MKLIFVGMKSDYGDPKRGLSFEYTNFYDTLRHLFGRGALLFDFMSEMQRYGQQVMNERLYEMYKKEKPDLMFFFLFKDEIYPQTIKRISEEGKTITFNWIADDHWRFDSYSKYWAPLFSYVATTASSAMPKYAAIGYRNAIKTQWGCNHFLYRKLSLPLKYEATFVGQPHGNRREVIADLCRAGVHVDAWGAGWEMGRISQEEMIKVFNQSRINLNLSNAATAQGRVELASTFLKFWKYPKFLLHPEKIIPKLKEKITLWQAAKTAEGEVSQTQQIKGRNFEIPGCGGFQLSGRADNLEEYFVPDREIVIFEDVSDLIDKARYYLGNEKKRAEIAKAGYERTIREHTYEKRFREVFGKMGLKL